MQRFLQNFQRILEPIKKFWSNLDQKKRLIVIASSVGSLVLIVILIVVLSSGGGAKGGWRVLFKNVSLEDMSKIVNQLDRWKIEYKTEDDTILVKSDQVDKLRIRLAGAGVLPSKQKGWEIFDEQKWSLSKFRDEVNFRRALQGALASTIESLDAVEKADVLIAMPEPKLYVEEEEPITASVRVTLKPFTELTPDQIKGIVNLVAYAVPGLKPDNVIVVDQHGVVLTEKLKEKAPGLTERAKELLKIRRAEERRLEEKIRERLKGVLGDDKVEVIVHLDLDFSKRKQESQKVEPVVVKKGEGKFAEYEVLKGLPVSREEEHEKFEGYGTPPEGPPGVEPNLPNYKEVIEKGKIKYARDKNIENLEINKVKTEEEKPPVEIKKVSVSVFVDGRWTKQINGTRIIRHYIPRNETEIKKIAELVKAAIGYDPGRGDMVSVKNVMFNREKEWEEEERELRRKKQLQIAILASISSLVFLAVGLLLIREIARQIRKRKAMLARMREIRRREEMLRIAEEEARKGVRAEVEIAKAPQVELLERIKTIAKERPKDVAMVVRNWLLEE